MAEHILHQSSSNSPTLKGHVHTNYLYSRHLVRNFQEVRPNRLTIDERGDSVDVGPLHQPSDYVACQGDAREEGRKVMLVGDVFECLVENSAQLPYVLGASSNQINSHETTSCRRLAADVTFVERGTRAQGSSCKWRLLAVSAVRRRRSPSSRTRWGETSVRIASRTGYHLSRNRDQAGPSPLDLSDSSNFRVLGRFP